MKNLASGIFLFTLLISSESCTFSSSESDDHDVQILAVSPQGPDQKTGTRQKFGVMLRDSGNPKKLNVYAYVDQGDRVECKFDTNPTNTIDRTVNETIFWCPIRAAGIRAGRHGVTFKIENQNGDEQAKRSASFIHDPNPPALQANVQRTGTGTLLTWSVEDPRDFRELTLGQNGVRVFTSFGASGETTLEDGLFKPGTEVELRAYDRLANVVIQTLTIP
jgi:hypothetical protein